MQKTVKIVNEFSEKVLYDIRVQYPLTILCDDSGTGKTALNSMIGDQTSNYVKVQSEDYSIFYAVRNDIDLAGLQLLLPANVLVICDENVGTDLINNCIEVCAENGCDLIIITRDLSAVNLEYPFTMATVLNVNGILTISYSEKDTAYISGEMAEICEVFSEDTTTGYDFLRMLLPNNVLINKGDDSPMGFHKLGDMFKNGIPLMDNTFIMADGMTYGGIYIFVTTHLHNCGIRACVFTPTCFEEVLLHCDFLKDASEIQEYLITGKKPEWYTNTEENYAYYLVLNAKVKPSLTYCKSRNYMDYRFVLQESLDNMKPFVPKVLALYMNEESLSTNVPVLSSLKKPIMSSEAFREFCCGKTDTERKDTIQKCFEDNPTSVDPSKLVSILIGNTKELRISELLENSSVLLALKDKGIPAQMSTLLSLLNSKTHYTVDEAISIIQKA